MDGAFKISPRLFTKLFTLHIVYLGFYIPVVYALLKDKSSNTYYQMFEVLLRKMATLSLILNSASLMLDFESTFETALKIAKLKFNLKKKKQIIFQQIYIQDYQTAAF